MLPAVNDNQAPELSIVPTMDGLSAALDADVPEIWDMAEIILAGLVETYRSAIRTAAPLAPIYTPGAAGLARLVALVDVKKIGAARDIDAELFRAVAGAVEDCAQAGIGALACGASEVAAFVRVSLRILREARPARFAKFAIDPDPALPPGSAC